jgi:hypothetical protein
MTSAVAICSNALIELGDKPISSFDENNDRTRSVANLYPMKRDAVLRAHPWNCATKRVVLSPDTDSPEFGWQYQFTMPANCLRVLSVGIDGREDDYQIEGRKILMNKNVCYLRYIWRNDVEVTWDATLIDAMKEVMKAAIAYSITKSTSKEQLVDQIVQRVLRSARNIDGQENPPETLGDFPLLANRVR